MKRENDGRPVKVKIGRRARQMFSSLMEKHQKLYTPLLKKRVLCTG